MGKRWRAALLCVAIVAPLAVITGGSPAEAAAPLGAVTTVARGIDPWGIARGPDGNLWFTNEVGPSIGRISLAGQTTLFSDSRLRRPQEITAGLDGNMWFTDADAGIGRITPTGSISIFSHSTMAKRPKDIAAGADGNLWFTVDNIEDRSVGRVTPAGVFSDFGTVLRAAGIDRPEAIAAGPDGNLWITSSDSIGRMTPGGVVSNFHGAGIARPRDIAAGSDGNLWFVDSQAIGRITPAGAVSSFPAALPGGPFRDDIPDAHEITAGPDGNMWFTNFHGRSIGGITPTGVVTTFSGIAQHPAGIAAGGDGNLWFTNYHAGYIGRITPAGVVTRHSDGVSFPSGIAAGPDGNMWFTNSNGPVVRHDRLGSIGRATPEGVVSSFTGPQIEHPTGIAAGADGNLWFTNFGGDSIGRVTPAGEVMDFTGTGIDNPLEIAAGPDGNLWFTNVIGFHLDGGGWEGSIGRITPEGVVSNFAGRTAINPTSINPVGIAAGPDGNLWFTSGAHASCHFSCTPDDIHPALIGRITPAGVMSTFSDPRISGPGGITAGPDGSLWFTNAGNSSIGRITSEGVISTFTGTGISHPERIASGPDGSLWFTNAGNSSIGRITPAGVVTTLTGDGIERPRGITAGPDGNLWFTNANSIAHVGTAPVLGPPATVSATAGDGQATATWTAPLSDGGLPIIGYRATASPGGQACAWSSGPLSCTVTGLSNGSSYTFTVEAINANGAGPASAASNAVVPARAAVAFHPLTPTRILDTRPAGPQIGPFGTPWSARHARDVTVAGMGGVLHDATAVVMNVTVTGTTGAGYLTIWPSGQPQPLASSLNWAPGQTTANTVTVEVGAMGRISALSPVGEADVIIDVVGYYGGSSGDGFTPLTPTRISDSRPGGSTVGPDSTPWGPNETRDVSVVGGGGVPAEADAVVVNVTVTGTTASGYLTIWSAGQDRPLASSLNWAPGQTIANAVTLKVGAGGKVSVFNPAGETNVIVDVVGFFAEGTGHLFHPLPPLRIQDSRPGLSQAGPYGVPWAAATARDVQLRGTGGVPSEAVAVLTNMTATGATASSYLTVGPAGEAAPLASSLNWVAGDTIANSVTAKLSPSGGISVRNAAGDVHVIADVAGWYG